MAENATKTGGRSRRPGAKSPSNTGANGTNNASTNNTGANSTSANSAGTNSAGTNRNSRSRAGTANRSTAAKQSRTPQPPVLAEQSHPELVEQLVNPNQKKAQNGGQGAAQKTAQPKTAQNQPKAAKAQPQQKPPAQAQNAKNQAVQAAKKKDSGNTPNEKGVKPAPAKNTKKPDNKAVAKTADQKPAQTQGRPKSRGNSNKGGKKPTLKIIPLGGLGEIGKNITYYEYDGEAFLVDCGITFPDEGMPGVDLVIPDFTYVIENKSKIRGLCITHGHEDHIGSIPYLLKTLNVPIYATRLTIGLIEGKLKEHGLLNRAKLTTVKAGDIVKLGKSFQVEYIPVNHSIPDACAFAIHTPAGIVVQTGDFKVDYTPIAGPVINLARFGELGSQGVLALLSDSTNAERPGATPSERTVGESLDELFSEAEDKRIIVATFASNVHRVQQIINAAVKNGRKVAVTGRSMENVVAKALELGYLEIPSGVLIEVDAASRYPSEKIVMITTGSQGEPMSALTRMATGDHRKIQITPHDCIIISASPIPGNEKLVGKVINELMKAGAQVIYEKMYDIHVSGHACQEEIKLMIALTKPKFFMPVHGEYKHLAKAAGLGRAMGISDENIMIADLGWVVEVNDDGIRNTGVVTAGKVLVDGLGVGDVGSIVLRDRKHLSEDGLIVVIAAIERKTGKIVSGPDIVSRGFVYVRESEDMIGKVRDIARKSIQQCMENNSREWGVLKTKVRDDVGDYLWKITKRNPMILPVIQEI
ncbi:MAG: RNase J family beta-CASP ribonuclease [Oscillospiraceae bacterium]